MSGIGELQNFVERHPRLVVLTGAGCSTASSIPDYRDGNGDWKRKQPVLYKDFINSPAVRQRYWGRSIPGWRHFGRAKPNAAHFALADLEKAGAVVGLITQNVDGLHQRAGSRILLALHGTLDRVRCLACNYTTPRDRFQRQLLRDNTAFAHLSAGMAPDGDADLDGIGFGAFSVPDCPACSGILKPDVVFYGESVPRERYRLGDDWLARADALLVVGSSLMVFSSFRFARQASALGKPIAAVNLGRTRADALFSVKVTLPCESVLPLLAAAA